MAARCVDGSEQPHSCRAAGTPSLAEKLLRLASFLLLRVALQLFLQLLVLYHLIGALPDLFISDSGLLKSHRSQAGIFTFINSFRSTSGQSRSCDGQQCLGSD
jgi:hypothetical protein